MSSLLDEAIVDAKALREAVLKNAEASLLEAYAPKIEEAVVKLLEQDPSATGLPMDIGSPMDAGMAAGMPSDLGVDPMSQDAETEATFPDGEEEELGDVSFAATSEIDDDSSLEDEVEIDITRGELKEMLESITRDIEVLEEQDIDQGTLEEEDVIELEEADIDLFEGEEEKLEEELKEEAEIELSEEKIEEIIESLVVDMKPTKRGWAGTPESEMKFNEELAAAMAQSDEYKEERDELLKVGKALSESLEKHKTVNGKLKEAVDTLKEKLDEVNLDNAKLLYTNRVLRKSSLNERQKETIVEALSNAGSVNEAKVIFETLQSTVGSSRKSGPQSLSEAVSRPSTMLPRTKTQSKDFNPFAERMKALAGIKKN